MKYLLILTIITLLFSCKNTQQEISQGYTYARDDFKGLNRLSALSDGPLDGQPFGSFRQVNLDIFVDSTDSNQEMWLVVIYQAEDWQFISPGESLILMVDGERIPMFTKNGSLLTRQYVGGLLPLREEAWYPLSSEQLKQMAAAKHIAVRIYGNNGTLTRSISNKQIQYYDMFLQKVVYHYGLQEFL